MPIIQPTLPRHTSKNTGSLLRVVIPAQKSIFKIVWFGMSAGLGLLLTIGLGSKLVVSAITDTETASNQLWIGVAGLMLVSFLFALHVLLWHLIGNETIEVGPNSIVLRRQVFPFNYSREYLAGQITNLRPFPAQEAVVGLQQLWKVWPFHLSLGTLAFDYGGKTIYIGSEIDEAEAKQIIAVIVQQFPQYQSQPSPVSNPSDLKRVAEAGGESLKFSFPNPVSWPLTLMLGWFFFPWVCLAIIWILDVAKPGVIGFERPTGVFMTVGAILEIGICGGLPFFGLLWQFTGREVIEVSQHSIQVSSVVAGLGQPRVFLSEHIQDLRITRRTPARTMAQMLKLIVPLYGQPLGAIAFDYGARTIQAGWFVERAEAQQILAAIQQRFPQYRN